MTDLENLPSMFTYRQARDAGVSRGTLYRLRDRGAVTRIGHGLYAHSSASIDDLDLVEIIVRADRPTLCLATALARHGLTDDIPAAYDVAIPSGTRAPAVTAPVLWHRFATDTFDLGRATFQVDGGGTLMMGIYTAERCIVDAFRLRGHEGHELGTEALRRWLRQGGQPSELLELAGHFRRAVTPIRTTLEILL